MFNVKHDPRGIARLSRQAELSRICCGPRGLSFELLNGNQGSKGAEAEKKRVDGEAELREARKARKQAAKDNCGSNFSKLLGRVRGQISRIRCALSPSVY